MTKKELEILMNTDRVDGSSYRTDPKPSPTSKRFEREKERLSFNVPNIKFQKAYYTKF